LVVIPTPYSIGEVRFIPLKKDNNNPLPY